MNVTLFFLLGFLFSPAVCEFGDKVTQQHVCRASVRNSETLKQNCASLFIPGNEQMVTSAYVEKCIKSIEEMGVENCKIFVARMKFWLRREDVWKKCAEILKTKPDLATSCEAVIKNSDKFSRLFSVKRPQLIDCGEAVKKSNIGECQQLVGISENQKILVRHLEECMASFQNITEVAELCTSSVDKFLAGGTPRVEAKVIIKCSNMLEKHKSLKCGVVISSANWARITIQGIKRCFLVLFKDKDKQTKCMDFYKTWRYGTTKEWEAALKENSECSALLKEESFRDCRILQQITVHRARLLLHQ